MIRGLTIVATLMAGQAQAADFYFCWTGSNDYTMTGQMTIDPTALNKPVVTEQDVTAFKIAGYLEGSLLGKWDMATREPDDSWVLNYDPAQNAFLTPAQLNSGVTQAWNADGTAMDCGTPGFGFNLGNFAQDFCLNSVWIEESGTPPETPFLVSATPIDPQCRIYTPLS